MRTYPHRPTPASLKFLTMTNKPSFRAEFKTGEGGEKVTWSEVTAATVTA